MLDPLVVQLLMTESKCISLAALKLAMSTKLTSNLQQFYCLCPRHPGITRLCHHSLHLHPFLIRKITRSEVGIRGPTTCVMKTAQQKYFSSVDMVLCLLLIFSLLGNSILLKKLTFYPYIVTVGYIYHHRKSLSYWQKLVFNIFKSNLYILCLHPFLLQHIPGPLFPS